MSGLGPRSYFAVGARIARGTVSRKGILIALEPRDELDVRGLREQIDGDDAAQAQAGLGEVARVARESGRIAGDVDQALELRRGQEAQRGLAQTGAGRVDDG